MKLNLLVMLKLIYFFNSFDVTFVSRLDLLISCSNKKGIIIFLAREIRQESCNLI